LLTFSHSAGEKSILRSVLLSFFSVFISSMPSKVIIIVIEFILAEAFESQDGLGVLDQENCLLIG